MSALAPSPCTPFTHRLVKFALLRIRLAYLHGEADKAKVAGAESSAGERASLNASFHHPEESQIEKHSAPLKGFTRADSFGLASLSGPSSSDEDSPSIDWSARCTNELI